mgnify:CR=1 FL=1
MRKERLIVPLNYSTVGSKRRVVDSIHDYVIVALSALGALLAAAGRGIIGNSRAIDVIISKHEDTAKHLDELKIDVKDGFSEMRKQFVQIQQEKNDNHNPRR